MKGKSEEETKLLLLNLFWDTRVDPDKLIRLLAGKIERIGSIDRSNLYCRILNSFDWHTILKIVPHSDLKTLLDDNILNRIHPKDLREKYLYARKVLSE